MKKKFVLDTSIFVNAQSIRLLGKDPKEAFKNFLTRAENKTSLEFYMPESVKEELLKFIGPQKLEPIRCLPPRRYELKVPALFLYELVEEMRLRINKGLRVAEKFTRKAIKNGEESPLIQGLRQEYRVALREGIIDSKEDMDLLLLSRQLKAILVSEDEGLKKWASKWGVECWNLKNLTQII